MSTIAVTNLKHESASGNNITLDSNGNVGIGGTAPSTNKLHVEGAGATRAVVYNSTNAVGVRVQALTGSGLIQTDTNHPLQFATNNGAVQMQVDTAGRVTMPYQPMFKAGRTAGNVAATSTVVFNVVSTNIGSHYNSSTGVFTAPIAGRYLFTAGLFNVTGVITYTEIRVNGSTVSWTVYSGSNYGQVNHSVVVELNAGDAVTVVVSSGQLYASGSQFDCYFSGILLG